MSRWKITITDRYTGMVKRPRGTKVCPGPCEGMGFYPDMKKKLSCDKTPFIKCRKCAGRGWVK